MELESLIGSLTVLALLTKTIETPEAAEVAAVGLDPGIPPRRAAEVFARRIGLSPRFHHSPLSRLADKDMPIAFRTKQGSWRVLVRLAADKALVQDPASAQVAILSLTELTALWEGNVVALRGQASRFDVRWFIPEFVRHRRLLGQALLASVFLQALALITPLFFQVVMDKVIAPKSLSTLDVLAMALAVVALLEVSLKIARDYIASHTTTRIDARLGVNLFQRLTELPLAYFKARSVGVTVLRMRELDIIRNFISGAGTTLTVDLLATVIFFAVMASYSLILTAVVLAVVPALFLIAWCVTPPLRQRLETLSQHSAANGALLNEVIAGAETVKALTLEPQLTARWENQTRDVTLATYRAQTLQLLSSQAVQGVQKVILVLVLWVGAHMVIALDLSLGQLIAFNMMANHVMQPVTRLAELWREYVQARVSVDRLGDVLNTPTERRDGNVLPAPVRGDVRFDNVSFRYDPQRAPVLNGISLHIPAGTMIGLVGESGCGKSTIAKLVQKLYIADEGQISIDGHDLRALIPNDLRQHISVVLQDDFLFGRSIRENIALTAPATPMETVVEAARAAGAHDFILGLPKGYDTLLSEGGRSLSGGERQRIAIARALIADARILILDEATSALDEESQALVQQNMARIRKGRTVIVIAHRLSAVRACDRIHVMERGQIVESGRHEHLLALGGRYAGLWARQAPSAAAQPVKRLILPL